MKATSAHSHSASQTAQGKEISTGAPQRPITRFGEMVDVRNRGALRSGRFNGTGATSQTPQHSPAVVRLWHAEHCKEMSAHEARAFAAQLLAAAALADSQNNH